MAPKYRNMQLKTVQMSRRMRTVDISCAAAFRLCSSKRGRSHQLRTVPEAFSKPPPSPPTSDIPLHDDIHEAMPDTAGEYKNRRAARARRSEKLKYQASAIAATALFSGLAVGATYYRFFFHSHDAFPVLEFWLTLVMIMGGMIGMEMWARWAHKALWHDFLPGWAIHKSHHEARTGPFEENDIFAVVNSVPAIALTAYGFFTPSEWGGVCFGLGMGITVFGVAYMFIHDGLVHQRFPVGPISEVPQLKKIAIAHRIHHTDKYGGLPYGMFLGPQELEAVGAGPELDRLVSESVRRSREKKERASAL